MQKTPKLIVAFIVLIISLWAIANLISSFQNIDRDSDGLSDEMEKKIGTDPLDSDSDNDGLNDLEEFNYWTNRSLKESNITSPEGDIDYDDLPNINDQDSDNDGISDGDELKAGTDPARRDSDNDGLDDDEEIEEGTDPNNPDSDGDGTKDGDDDTPIGPQNPGDITYDESSLKSRGPSRYGSHSDPTCFCLFDPCLGGLKRYNVYDSITENYYTYVSDKKLYPLELGTKQYQNVFRATITLENIGDNSIIIPSVAPNANIVSYYTSPDVSLNFFKDGADNYYVKKSSSYHHLSRLTLTFSTSADSSYYTIKIPEYLTLNDIPNSLKINPPNSVIQKANVVIDHLGLTGVQNLKTIIHTLINYFSDYTEGEIPSEEEQPDPYLAMALTQHGACYVRSFACFITANSIGIPTRLVTNECHAFVEMYIPENGWTQVNLGGLGGYLVNPSNSDLFDEYDQEIIIDDDNETSPGELTPTNTTISYVSPTAFKEDYFYVEGYVRDKNNSAVSNMLVIITVNKTKSTPGNIAGIDYTDSTGYFRIECNVPTYSEVGSNQIVAQAVRNNYYDESWSDPEIEIYSNTTINLESRNSVAINEQFSIKGNLTDVSGIPIESKIVKFFWDEEYIGNDTTNSLGEFQLEYSPSDLNAHTVIVKFEGDTYLRESQASMILLVKDYSTNIIAEINPTTAFRGEEITVKGKLSTETGTMPSSSSILIYHDGEITAKTQTSTDGSFQTTYIIPGSSSIGGTNVKIQYPGSILYAEIDTVKKITINANTFLTITNPKQSEFYRNETVEIEGTLTDDVGQTIPFAGIEIKWILLNENVTANENGEFQANHTLDQNTSYGASVIKAEFQGKNYYLPSSDSINIKVVPPGAKNQGKNNTQNTNIILLIAIIIIVIGIIGGYMLFKKQKKEEYSTIEQIASQTISQLRSDNNYRKSVLNCYKQMCHWLYTKGIQKKSCHTPREFAMAARNYLQISPEGLYNLTQIFEKARYSKHEISVTDRDNAIKYLNEILSSPINVPSDLPQGRPMPTGR